MLTAGLMEVRGKCMNVEKPVLCSNRPANGCRYLYRTALVVQCLRYHLQATGRQGREELPGSRLCILVSRALATCKAWSFHSLPLKAETGPFFSPIPDVSDTTTRSEKVNFSLSLCKKTTRILSFSTFGRPSTK